MTTTAVHTTSGLPPARQVSLDAFRGFTMFCLVDVRKYRKWALPLVVIGTNALAAYLGPSIVPTRRIAGIFTEPLARQIGAAGPFFSSSVVLLVNWLILYCMYKRKIFLRA